MKLYETATAPNPRRVRMVLAEKGLLDQVDIQQIDIAKGENLTSEFVAKNPMKKVPVLELDDGTCISETLAICRYFEDAYPDTMNLFGTDPLEKAQIEQWLRWLEFYFMMPCGMGFQHSTGYFKDRMTPVPEWGAVCIESVKEFFVFLNNHLADHEYLCADRFTAADISAFTTAAFARVINIRIGDDLPHLKAWFERIKARPSAAV